MSLVAIAGKPGHYMDRSNGEEVVLTEAHEGARYDSVEVLAAQLDTSENRFFRDITSKEGIDANFPSAGNVVSDSELLTVERVGVHVEQSAATVIPGSADIKRILCHGFLSININKKLFTEGPLLMYPPGLGVSGNSTETDVAMVNNGLPSAAAQRPMIEQQILTRRHTVKAVMTFPSRGWMTVSTPPTTTVACVVRLYFFGLFEEAATNN